MRLLALSTCLMSFLSLSAQTFEGIFVGYEELCFIDSLGIKNCELDGSLPGYLWFHQTTLKLSDGNVYVDKMPVLINGTDTGYSSSDGGFIYERGTYRVSDSVITMDVNFYYCDYCAMQVDSLGNLVNHPSKTLTATVNPTGLTIDKVSYTKHRGQSYTLRSEGPKPTYLIDLEDSSEESD